MIERDLSTPENRAFWTFVEQTAADVRAEYEKHPWMKAWADHFLCNIDGGGRCNRGDGTQTCSEFAAGTTPGTAIPYGS